MEKSRAAGWGAPRLRGRWLATALVAVAAIVAGLVVLLATGSSGAPGGHPFRAVLTTGIDGACGAAVDPKGDVYVATAGGGAIEILSPEGKKLGTVKSAGSPCGLAVDSEGVLYASDRVSGDVVRYMPNAFPFNGAPGYQGPTTIDSSGRAKGIAVDPYDNRLYVAEGDHIGVYQPDGTLGQDEKQRVLVYSATGGSFTLSFKGSKTKPIPYNATHAEVQAALTALPTIGAGNVSVSEGTNGERDHFITFTGALGSRRVPLLKYDASKLKGGLKGGLGKSFVVEVLIPGFDGRIGDGMLNGAIGVGIYTYRGSEGEEAQSMQMSLPESGSGEALPVSFGGAHSLFIHHKPVVYLGLERYVFAAETAEQTADRVYVFGGKELGAMRQVTIIHGRPDGDLRLPYSGAFLGVDQKNGHFYVPDAQHSAVDEFEATGAYVGEIGRQSFSEGGPAGVAVDRSGGLSDGTVYVTNGPSSDGETLAFGPRPAPKRQPAPGFKKSYPGACGVAVDSHGDVYVAGPQGIRIYDPNGNQLQTLATAGRPCSLAVDSKGNLYASEVVGKVEGHDLVAMYRPGIYPPTASTKYAKPQTITPYEGFRRAIAVNPINDHLLLEKGETRIAEYRSAAEGSKPINEEIGNAVIGQLGTFNGGIDVCGMNGDIYAAGRGAPMGWRVYVLSPDGTKLLTVLDGSGSPRGPFMGHATGLSLDQSDCHVFIGVYARPVEEFEASGAYVGAFGPLEADVAVDNGRFSPHRGDVYAAGPSEGLGAFGPLSR